MFEECKAIHGIETDGRNCVADGMEFKIVNIGISKSSKAETHGRRFIHQLLLRLSKLVIVWPLSSLAVD